MRHIQLSFIALLLALPGIALAHTGPATTSGFIVGFTHPFTGIGHLLAMLAVGIWAAQIGGRGNWWVPGVFITVMTVAGISGMAGLAIPYVEQGIVVSIVVLGIVTASVLKLPLLYSAMLVGCFAVFHGHAHGAEMPLLANTVIYIAGFSLATAMLHLVGIAIGGLMQNPGLNTVQRLAGSSIALSGIYLAIT